MSSIKSWEKYYDENKNTKPLIPENFVARIFLSTRPIKLLEDYNFKDKKILDLGCGDGRHIDFFLKLGFNPTGIEISKKKVDDLSKKFKSSNFSVGKASSLAFKDKSFDFLAAINSIYYLDKNDSLEKNIINCSRVLKNDGIFIASFVGKNHFIFDNNSKLNYKNHQCSDSISIKAVSSKEEINTLFKNTPINIKFIGEIHDELNGLDRHLYYIIGKKGK